MAMFGKKSKCCCFPLAFGCILGGILNLSDAIGSLTYSIKGDIPFTIFNFFIFICVFWGLFQRNFIFLSIAAYLTLLPLLGLLFLGGYLLISTILLKKYDMLNDITLEFIIMASIISIVYFIIKLIFFNIYLSTSNIIKVGGTGWEGKNYKKIKRAKLQEAKESENGNGNGNENGNENENENNYNAYI